jgi:hypothetical protein
MNPFKYNAIAMMIGAAMFLPLSPPSARADDDDDWEDRWEEYEEDREEAREDYEEWLEDRDDDFDDRRWYGHYWPREHRVYRYPRHYNGYYDDRPVHRYYHPEGRRVYRYYDGYDNGHPRVYHGFGRVHAGPVDVYYGRHGSVHVGPVHVQW